MAVSSTITLFLEYGTDIEPEDDIIECAIYECHDFMYRHAFWIEQVLNNIDAADARGFGYIDSLVQSIHELERTGYQFEPLPDVYPELNEWLTFL